MRVLKSQKLLEFEKIVFNVNIKAGIQRLLCSQKLVSIVDIIAAIQRKLLNLINIK